MDEMIERRNRLVCVLLEFMRPIFLGTPVMNIYYIDLHGLTSSQVFLLQAVLNVTILVSGIPFGYLADRFGVRRITIVGTVIQIAQGVGFIFCQTFWQFVLALIGTGLYVSALSSTGSSLMTRSLGYVDNLIERKEKYNAYETAAGRARSVGVCVGVGAGAGVVYYGGITVPFVVQPFIFGIGFLLALGLKRPTHQAQAGTIDLLVDGTMKTMVVDMIKAFKMMLIDLPAVRYVVLMYSVVASCAFVSYWMLQLRLKVAHIDPKYFGALYLAQYAIVALLLLASQLIRGQKGERDSQVWLWSLVGIASLAVAVGITTSAAPILVFAVVQTFAMSLLNVVIKDYLHGTLPQDYRSRTVELSVMGSFVALCYTVMGLLCGWLASSVSVGVVYIAVAVLGLGCGYPAYRAFRKHAR